MNRTTRNLNSIIRPKTLNSKLFEKKHFYQENQLNKVLFVFVLYYSVAGLDFAKDRLGFEGDQ